MTHRPTITDDMLRAGVRAMKPDRIQGFSTPKPGRLEWGAPHYIRDVFLPLAEQELWRGKSHAEMMERCAMERLRLAFNAAFGEEARKDDK